MRSPAAFPPIKLIQSPGAGLNKAIMDGLSVGVLPMRLARVFLQNIPTETKTKNRHSELACYKQATRGSSLQGLWVAALAAK
jgi:hypothetical protein